MSINNSIKNYSRGYQTVIIWGGGGEIGDVGFSVHGKL